MMIAAKEYLKKNRFPLLLIIGFILFYLLTRIIHPTVSIFAFKEQYPLISSFLLFIIILIPLLWLVLSNEWKSIGTYRKILILGISIAALCINYSFQSGTYGVVAFAVCTLIFLYKERKVYKPEVIHYLFVAYFLFHLISLLWAKDVGAGLKRLEVYIPFIVIPLLFCFFKLQKKEIENILFIFYRGTIILVFISLCCWLFQSVFYDVPLAEWLTLKKKIVAYFGKETYVYHIIFAWSNYPHPTYNSLGYLFGMSIAFYLYTANKGKITTLELSLSVVLSLLLVITTQSRTGLLNWMVLVFVGIAWLLKDKKKTLTIYCIAGLLGAVLFSIFFSDKIYGFIYDPIRAQNFDTAFEYIKSNTLLGTGIGGMNEIMNSHEFARSLGYGQANINLANPHNQFVGDLMETGMFGLILVCIIVVYMFYISIKQRNWPLFIFQICFFQLMLIEMPLYLSKGIFYYVFLSCLLLQYKGKTQMLNRFSSHQNTNST
ncbi:O-antigen ligase domain-containing protein [Paludibacter sp. 221]|uniref:O-antigen ligase family protein n=1 Tax=Paludibacter sp. 221 TaxID=2302939 RepID=UPI0013D5F53F|nr:O-antigen ligase family protein [Paludibacter sp. 221]NDV47867.1 O-antigen ligase domain-containing protein [Paludibacter sp. 221]